MLRLLMLVAAVLVIGLGAVRAQDAKQGAGGQSRTLLDNDRFKVVELHLEPGAKIELPSTPNQFAYLLTNATLVFSRPGHTPYELSFKAGEATLLPAQSTHAENASRTEVRAVMVELKGSGRGAVAAKGKGGRHKAGRRGKSVNIKSGPGGRKTLTIQR